MSSASYKTLYYQPKGYVLSHLVEIVILGLWKQIPSCTRCHRNHNNLPRVVTTPSTSTHDLYPDNPDVMRMILNVKAMED